MQASQKKIDYINQYNSQKYDHINLLVPAGKRNLIKVAAKTKGMSTNAFILYCIQQQINLEE